MSEREGVVGEDQPGLARAGDDDGAVGQVGKRSGPHTRRVLRPHQAGAAAAVAPGRDGGSPRSREGGVEVERAAPSAPWYDR